MARTDQERLERLQQRLVVARENQEKNQRFANEGATTCQVWADHFEGVALNLEQRIYELRLALAA